MALVTPESVIGCMAIEEVGPGRWRAPNVEMDYRRVFGGQLLAQAIAVATASAPGKSVRSLSCLFPREGSLDEPFEFEVEESQSGKAFAARRISASQHGKVFFMAQVSMHSLESGPEFQTAAPDLGAPQDAVLMPPSMIPWELRVVGGVDLSDRAVGPAEYSFWTRVPDRSLGDDQVIHQGLLAYATDLTVIGTALRPIEGLGQADAHHTLHTAVTAHTMWFHRPFRIDDWCLVHQHVPVVAGARAFGTGIVFDAAGDVVANFSQESMIRPVEQFTVKATT
jgi:acyl-CoA thioesterase II